jgi:cell division septal protein FtsQ
MGRYADELRRITRAQGGAPSPGPTGPDQPAPGHRRHVLLVAMAIVVVLAGVGWVIVRQLMADSKLQDCVMSGRKNCAPVEIDSAGR